MEELALNEVFGRLFVGADIAACTPLENADSISNAVALGSPSIQKCTIVYQGATRDVVVKHKSAKILLNGIKMLSGGDLGLGLALVRHHKIFSYNQSYRREGVICQNLAPELRQYLLPFYGAYTRGAEQYLVIGFFDAGQHTLVKNDYRQIFDVMTDINAHYNQKS